jgi:hypothetical protein
MTEQIPYYDITSDDKVDTSSPNFPKKRVSMLVIFNGYNNVSFMKKLSMKSINYALDNIEYDYCRINLLAAGEGLCVKKKIKCVSLRITTLNNDTIKYFDVSYFREIRAENILCPLEGLFYCNVNIDKPVYEYYYNYEFIEGLKIIKGRIKNDDVLFEIFKKGYTDPMIRETAIMLYEKFVKCY